MNWKDLEVELNKITEFMNRTDSTNESLTGNIELLSERIAVLETTKQEVSNIGGLRLDVIYEDGEARSFYMVKDMHSSEDELMFSHLVKPAKLGALISSEDTTELSFPKLEDGESLFDYVNRLEESGNFDKVITSLNLMDIDYHQLRGGFTYRDTFSGEKQYIQAKRQYPDNVTPMKKPET